MNSTISVVSGLVEVLLMCGLGLYTFRRGWTMVRAPTTATLSLPRLVAIALVRMIQGEAAAMRKNAELSRPDAIRRSGYYALIVGSGLCIGGCLGFAGWIGKLIGL